MWLKKNKQATRSFYDFPTASECDGYVNSRRGNNRMAKSRKSMPVALRTFNRLSVNLTTDLQRFVRLLSDVP